MSKHTPGPWTCDRAYKYNRGYKVPLIVPVDGENPVAELTVDYEAPVMRANARLIAAAPDLLEALIAVNDFISGKPDAVEPFGLVRAAIAKATGE